MIKNVGDMSSLIKSYNAQDWAEKTTMRNNDRNLRDVGQGEGDYFKLPQRVQEGEFENNPGVQDKRTFGDFLMESVAKVNELQQEANVAVEKLATGQSQNLHETMLIVEQAEIAYKTMNQIRMKVIDAYKEIMKTQI